MWSEIEYYNVLGQCYLILLSKSTFTISVMFNSVFRPVFISSCQVHHLFHISSYLNHLWVIETLLEHSSYLDQISVVDKCGLLECCPVDRSPACLWGVWVNPRRSKEDGFSAIVGAGGCSVWRSGRWHGKWMEAEPWSSRSSLTGLGGSEMLWCLGSSPSPS